ncbi:MAG: carbamoyl-phosphate synthase large subunit [Anaerovoracaceae bacterium]|nr:carbamoyl-phosphate synthase large subunit [Bacillota bacterium]MDY2670741.1 carbamoyl-phosphate synthase large subunit [Anaerovoracaceae bacterium]
MPLNSKLKKVMVIGSGPIVIGQAAEFDYAGTQACRALKQEGLEVVLVNSNPATIMTDNQMADAIYIEPLTLDVVKRIIKKEKPDGLLSTLGGQTGLTLSMQLAKEGFLEEQGVMLLGANPETIDKAEDRQQFKDTMEAIGQPVIPSIVVNDVESAVDFANEIGYPIIIRPAFTLGGTGGGIVNNEAELREITANGLRLSPITQVLVEKSIAGWKEIEFEVMRDSKGNVITVCSMENFDPVGVHTGDSIVIAPCVTLSDKEYQMLRSAALSIISELKVEGGCNCQFALKPDSFEYAVIEVNPRVSRSSALASKATGYPIAKVAAKIAIGFTLDEIKNAVTGNTYACFEPALDYVVVKFPKWPFDKFVYAKRTLGTQMKATGEVMAIGQTFEEALMKAVRGCEIGHKTLDAEHLRAKSDEEIRDKISVCDDERLFVLYQALSRGIATVDEIHDITKIDKWFLEKIVNIVNMEKRLGSEKLDDTLYLDAKKMSFLDTEIERLSGQTIQNKRHAVYKMVDTCAAEFDAETPYFYSTYDDENEAESFIREQKREDDPKGTIIVFGSGPIRIGQGIEFDYSSVQCVWALKKAGYEVVIVNNNPETVSTDFDTADRLYFEPLTDEDVMNIINTEKPDAVVVAYGGGTAIKLTKHLNEHGVRILGTPADSIDMAEDRERFDELLGELQIKRAEGLTVMTTEEALEAANRIGYPVLMRPSYVLGGQNMIIAFDDDDIKEYMAIILRQDIENPILIDKYLQGIELEVDAICDGKDILIPGIMEHIERTGIHSGDSIAVYPAWNITDDIIEKIIDQSAKLALSMKTLGLVNIQYLIYHNDLYVIEVNPRSSRTVPYISKVTGVPMVELATRAMLGEKLADMGYGTGLYRKSAYYAVKVPVFSFEKLINVDTHLGPEMKSTGEVLGIASTLEEALYKGLVAAGYKMKRNGGVLITVRDRDKPEIADIARGFAELGFDLYATEGTARVIEGEGMTVHHVDKIHESDNNCMTVIERGIVDYVISTDSRGRIPTKDSVRIRRKTVEHDIPCLTSIDTANALVKSLRSRFTQDCTELVNINDMREERQKLHFMKLSGTSNDYIYFNCFDQHIDNPGGLSVMLSDRHLGIGGDGICLIYPSKIADARVELINKDGTDGGLSGNALRCVGKYLHDSGIAPKDTVTVEADNELLEIDLIKRYGEVVAASVDMGEVRLEPELIPVNIAADKVIDEPVTIGSRDYNITCVSIGNPHCVVFVKNVDNIDVPKIGPVFEHNKLFPERTNTEFVKVISPTKIKMRVWERGNGETWACGTGACAAVVAAVENGFCEKDKEITVQLIGGELKILYSHGRVRLTGDCRQIFEGNIIV